MRLIKRFWKGKPYLMPTKFDPSLNTSITFLNHTLSLKVDDTFPDEYILLKLC